MVGEEIDLSRSLFPDAGSGLGLEYGRRSQPFDLTPAYATRIRVSFSQTRK